MLTAPEMRTLARQRAGSHANGWYQLCVSDDGQGFPEGLDFRSTDSLGLKLVCTLTEQLFGTITLQREAGTRFTIRFRGP